MTTQPIRGVSIYDYNFTTLIIYMKKSLDSDWLRAVQFKRNTSAKSVTLVQITHHNSGLWLAEKKNRKFCKPMIPRKMMTKILCGNFEKRFREWKKMAPSKTPSGHFSTRIFSCFYYLQGIIWFFSFNLELISTCEFSKKAEIALAEVARAISAFWKTHSCKLIPNWSPKPYDYLFQLHFLLCRS